MRTLNIGLTAVGEASLAGSALVAGDSADSAGTPGLEAGAGDDEGSSLACNVALVLRFRFLGSLLTLAPASRASMKSELSCSNAEKHRRHIISKHTLT